jgi:AcrR family transcriptional regulator
VATRTRLSPEARRAQLIDVASELFATKPYGDVAIEQIARRAGVRHGLIYHYFPDKRHLYIEVVRHWADQIGEAARTDPALDPIERVYAGLRTHLDFVEQHLVGYLALITGGNGSDPEVHAINEQARWNGLRHVLKGLDIEQPTPALRIALRGWAGFNEGAIIEWLKQRDISREQLIDIMAQALLATLDTPTPRSPRPDTSR